MDAVELADRFGHGGWDVQIFLSWDYPERRYAGRAELFQAGTMKCRIALGGRFDLAAGALADLRARAQAFIDDWRHREHGADSEFSEL